MTSKEKILAFLENNKGVNISGASLAKELGISRAAVWKAMDSLRSDGFEIDAASGRGYCLANTSDVLNKSGILSFLPDGFNSELLHVFNEINSTNTYAKTIANEGAVNGTIIVSASQTAGRGRMGRSFQSPEGGIYISFLLRPNLSAQQSLCFTTASCVGICRAIEKATNKTAEIKWVNDIFYNDKKVCGILTEASTNVENGMIDYIVVGAGLNFATHSNDFAPELKDIATSIYPDGKNEITRNEMVAHIINEVLSVLENPTSSEVAKEYKERSFIIGKKITVVRGDFTRDATAVDITDDANLCVVYEDRTKDILQTGEVRIRPNF